MQRFKVTASTDSSGNFEFFIDKTKDIKVITTYVVLAAHTSNILRDVSIERTDGTILGEQKAHYKTSESCSLIFPDSFVVPHFDPLLVLDTRTVLNTKAVTVDIIYEVVKLA